MYDDDEYDDITDIGVGISRMLMSAVFLRLPQKFTTRDFTQSFKRTFSKELDDTDILSTLNSSLISEIVSQDEDANYQFNGIFIESLADN